MASRRRIDPARAPHTELADAQALAFDDGAFDVVLSTFGVGGSRTIFNRTRSCRVAGAYWLIGRPTFSTCCWM